MCAGPRPILRCLRHRFRWNTSPSRLVREAVMREPDAGRSTYAQVDRACAIAHRLGRGKLVLVEPPKR
jgi:hypothetical protein